MEINLKTYKMKNLHLLSSSNQTRLHYYEFEEDLVLSSIPANWRSGKHIYITSDEEIKDGDYAYSTAQNHNIQKVSKHFLKAYRKCKHYKKIILTTNPELIQKGVQAVDDEFLDWFMKNPSCEWVEVEEKQRFEANKSKRKNPLNGVYYSYKIIIPKEKPKQKEMITMKWFKKFKKK